MDDSGDELADYVCGDCGATGVKLWTRYITLRASPESGYLRCAARAAVAEGTEIGRRAPDGSVGTEGGYRSYAIGSHVAALLPLRVVYGDPVAIDYWRALPNFP